jgi:UDP-3-O-[3-hydroxymyristoyl] glucosamine N-acyltransferase
VAVTLDEVVGRLGGELRGDGSASILRIATLEHAGTGDICFLANPKYRGQLAATRATAVILGATAADDCPVSCIVTAQPYLYFARLAQWLNPLLRPAAGVDPAARVGSPVPASASVGAGASVGVGVRIGDEVAIGPGCVIGDGVEIGAGSMIYGNVSIYAGCRVAHGRSFIPAP